MKPKSGFSPWHTKQNSFQYDHSCLPLQPSHKHDISKNQKHDKKSQSKLSSRKKPKQEQQSQTILRSFSKTENFVSQLQEDCGPLGFRRKVTRSSHKIDCQVRDDRSGKKFDDQKWRILAITSNDRFKSQCAQLRKYQHLATQLKSRRSSLRHTPLTQQKQRQKPALQQLSIKNFIIHGHYTDKESLFMLGKRRDAAHVMKQKFATLKKTIQSKENCETDGRKVVVVRGNVRQQKQENLFKVIKIEREIKANLIGNNRVL